MSVVKLRKSLRRSHLDGNSSQRFRSHSSNPITDFLPVVLPLAPHRRPPIRRRGRSGPWLRSANELRIHSRSRRYFSANAFLSYANACRPKLFHFTVSVGRFYKKGSPKSWVMSMWCVFPPHDFDSILDLLTQLNCLNNTRI